MDAKDQFVGFRFKMAPWDEGAPMKLRALKAWYAENGAHALVLWECDDRGMLVNDDSWCVATVNGVGPDEHGLLTLDSNNMPKELVEALLELPTIESTGIMASSGFCEYPVVKCDVDWLEGLVDASDEEALDAIMDWDTIMG